MLQGKWEHRLA